MTLELSKRLASILVVFVLLLLSVPNIFATPRMSMISGSPCSTCHVNPQGSGIRTSIGWRTSTRRGLVDYTDLGVESFPPETNTFADDKISVGGDMRLQLVRIGEPSRRVVEKNGERKLRGKLPERRLIPMQFEPGVAVRLHDYVTLSSSYNINGETFQGDLCNTVFAGQSCFEAQAEVSFDPAYPGLRFGMIQPTFGIRHDDHTRLIRDDASPGRRELIPPNYAELGGEIFYNLVSWFRAEGGLFRAQNLSRSLSKPSFVSQDQLGYSGRISFRPKKQWSLDYSFNGFFGASILGAGDFRMYNGFAGIGWLDRAAILFEAAYMQLDPALSRNSINTGASLWLKASDWLYPYIRAERANTSDDNGKWVEESAVAGLHLYPIPFVEIRPEYRYKTTNDWQMGQYTVQFHLFY